LLKHSYSGASWQRKRAQVGALQKSTLYGLVVIEKKRVNFGPIDPAESRKIFIREALVGGNYNTNAAFYQHNLKLIDEVLTLEDKSRRRDILVDPEELYSFYEQLVPEGIYSGPLFEKWRDKYERDNARGLYLSKDYLLREDDPGVDKNEFPDQMEFSDLVLPLKYNFKPGAHDDGVTLMVPVTLLNRLNAAQCEWLVPGMLEEKVVALIKSLPKQLRRNFVPAPDYASNAVAVLDRNDKQSLVKSLSEILQRMTGVALKDDDWQVEQFPAHLLMRIEVLDADGGVLDEGRDLVELQKKYLDQIEENLASGGSGNSFERTELTDWNFGDLPPWVEVENQGVTMKGYPGLTAEEGVVNLRLFATSVAAAQAMPAGLRLLYKKKLSKDVKYLIRNLPGIDELCLRFAAFGKSDLLKQDIVDAAIDWTFIVDREFPTTRETFLEILESQKQQLVLNANKICKFLSEVFAIHRDVARRIGGSISLSWVEAVADIKDQIDHLIYPGFVVNTPPDRMARFPVYLNAIAKRLDTLDREPDRDRRRRAELLPVWEQIKIHLTDVTHPDVLRCRWMMEELRVSVYAQELGTAEKVSVGRIETILAKI